LTLVDGSALCGKRSPNRRWLPLAAAPALPVPVFLHSEKLLHLRCYPLKWINNAKAILIDYLSWHSQQQQIAAAAWQSACCHTTAHPQ
jgi:hypothetical protein